MLQHALSIARRHGYENLIAEFITSKRNKVAEGFLDEIGFTRINKVDQLVSKSTEAWSEMYIQSISSGSRLYVMSTQTMSLPYKEIYEGN